MATRHEAMRLLIEDLKAIKIKGFTKKSDGNTIKVIGGGVRQPANDTAIAAALEIGAKMADGTIYLGQYRPKDRDGKSLSKIFNVFAAPEDLLPKAMEYIDTVKHIATLKNWHGYDGTNYETDEELYAAIENGSFSGGWIIPTSDILYGKNHKGKDTTPDNLLAHKEKGAFKGTFKMAPSCCSDPDQYWSSTRHPGGWEYRWTVRLSDGKESFYFRMHHRLSCRPVRLVEVPVVSLVGEPALHAVQRQPVRSSPKHKCKR